MDSYRIENPELWRLSMLIGNDGIDVLARRVVGGDDVVSMHLPFDPSLSSPASAVEEIVYSNPMLLMPFGKIDIVFSGGFSLVVPSGTAIDDIDSLFPSSEPTVTLSVKADNRNDIVFRVDRDMYNFIIRTFDSVVPVHSLAVLAGYFNYRSHLGNSNKMYAVMGGSTMEVLIFNHVGLAMASSFVCPDVNTVAYYVLASANTAAFDFTNDEVRIAGFPDRRAAITPVLKRFMRHVIPAVFPASAAEVPPTVPFTLVVLPLCE